MQCTVAKEHNDCIALNDAINDKQLHLVHLSFHYQIILTYCF